MAKGSKAKLSVRLSEAQSLERQGRLEEAGALYEGIVGHYPQCGEAWFGLGVLAMRIGDLELAATFLEQARAVGLGDVAVLINLGEIYRRQGLIEQAVAVLSEVCGKDKRSRDGRINLAAALAGGRRYAEALEPLEEALLLDRNAKAAWLMKGEVHKKLGQLDDAAAAFRKSLELNPKDSEARLGLAETLRLQKQFATAIPEFEALLQIDARHQGALTGLAAIALEQKDFAAAEAAYQQVLAADPAYWEALFGLGVAYIRGEKFQLAEEALRKALAIDDQRPDAWLQLGESLFHMNRYEDAQVCYEKGLELDPNSVSCQVGIGNTFLHLERLDEAIAQYKAVEAVIPNDFRVLANLALAYQEVGNFELAHQYGSRAVELGGDEDDKDLASQNLAQICLRQGKLEEGWKHYESRRSNQRRKTFSMPEWQGEPLSGKRLLIWQDQGLGDVVLFGTIYQEIIDEAEAVVIECERKLLSPIRRSFPQAIVIARSKNKPHPLHTEGVDYHIAGGSLPRVKRRNLAAFPRATSPMLRVDPERAVYWRQRFDRLGPELKVGICWRSMLSKGLRELSYSDISEWGEVFALPGVRLVNLQYDQCEPELAQAGALFGKSVENFREVDMFDDIDETSALISQLDLVITAPTLVSRLAAGVGVPTVLATTFFDWTQFDCEEDPWTPNMVRFQRRWNQSWSEIFGQVADLIRRRYPALGESVSR